MSPPKLKFVRTLACAITPDDADALFVRGLGAAVTGDDEFALGDAALRAVPPTDDGPRGFIPLFVTDDLQRACDHFVDEGLSVRDLPWSPTARAVLVGGVGGVWICVAAHTALYE